MNNNLNRKQSPIKSNQILGGEMVKGGVWTPKKNVLLFGHNWFLFLLLFFLTQCIFALSPWLSLILIFQPFPDKPN